MKKIESQQVEGLAGDRSSSYEVILWELPDHEIVEETLGLFESQESGFVIEVREHWASIRSQEQAHRQVSRLEVGTLGMAYQLYHFTAETLFNL